MTHQGREKQRLQAHERDLALVEQRKHSTVAEMAYTLGVTQRSLSSILWRARRRLARSESS